MKKLLGIFLFLVMMLFYACDSNTPLEFASNSNNIKTINIQLITYDNVIYNYQVQTIEYGNQDKREMLILNFETYSEYYTTFTNKFKYFKVY